MRNLTTVLTMAFTLSLFAQARAQEGDEPGQPGAAEPGSATEEDDADPELSDAEREDALIKTQLKIAELHEAKNDIATALKLLRDLLKQRPENMHIAARVARLAFDLQQYDVVLQVGRKLVMRYPSNVRYRLWVATAMVAKGQSTKALHDLEWLQRKRPNDPEVRKDLASAYEQLKQPARALVHYDWLIAREPRNVEYHLARAGLYGDLKQEKKQRQELTLILQLAPDNMDVRLELAEHAYHRERFDEAESHAKVVLSRDPRNMKALALLDRIKKARERAKRKSVQEFRMDERFGDFQSDLQERSEDF
jgi:tetratricopeptide (TPR) repeat protein